MVRYGSARLGTVRLSSGRLHFTPAPETVAVPRAVEEESRDVRAGVLRYLIS